MNHIDLFHDYRNIKQAPSLTTAEDDILLSLVAGKRNQGEDAFQELYRRYSGAILNYLLRLIHEYSDAEDLLQEVFMAVWQGAGTFQGRAKVKTWIYRIAHNQAVSWLRHHHPVTAVDDVHELSDGPEMDDLVISHWQITKLQQSLDALSVKHREVLELAFAHEMPYAEIAEIVHCPVGTVKSRMSYALQALKRLNSERKSDV